MNEFQRFVEGATGRLLPIFGSSFFADAAGEPSRSTTCRSPADYTIGPGDWDRDARLGGAIDVDYRSTVDRNGMLNHAQGRQLQRRRRQGRRSREKNLRAQIGRLYTNFEPVGVARPEKPVAPLAHDDQ